MVSDMDAIRALFDDVWKVNRSVLFPMEAESVLKNYGIENVKSAFAKNNFEEIVRSAENIGFPVVLKLISPDILHKTDAGCIKLSLANTDEISEAYHEILENATKVEPSAEVKGFLVQKMVQYENEVIVGLANDLTFGKIIMFGLGGIFVEVLNDVAIRKVPITQLDAKDMIEEIKGYVILQGVRGKESVNFNLLQEILLNVSRLGVELQEIKEMDLNPVFVNASSALVADSRILI